MDSNHHSFSTFQLYYFIGSNETISHGMDIRKDSPASSTEAEWVTFPPGDILNDPWFKKSQYVFPKNETILVSMFKLLCISVY